MPLQGNERKGPGSATIVESPRRVKLRLTDIEKHKPSVKKKIYYPKLTGRLAIKTRASKGRPLSYRPFST